MAITHIIWVLEDEILEPICAQITKLRELFVFNYPFLAGCAS